MLTTVLPMASHAPPPLAAPATGGVPALADTRRERSLSPESVQPVRADLESGEQFYLAGKGVSHRRKIRIENPSRAVGERIATHRSAVPASPEASPG